MSPATPMSRRSSASSLTMRGVVTRVGRRRRVGLDLQQRDATADVVEQVGAPQLLGDGDRVGRLALAVQRLDGLVDVAVRGLVEVAGLDVRLDRGGDRVAREQHRAEQRLLGLEVVRGHASARATTHRIDRLDHYHSPLRRPADARSASCVPVGVGRGTRLWIDVGRPASSTGLWVVSVTPDSDRGVTVTPVRPARRAAQDSASLRTTASTRISTGPSVTRPGG